MMVQYGETNVNTAGHHLSSIIYFIMAVLSQCSADVGTYILAGGGCPRLYCVLCVCVCVCARARACVCGDIRRERA